MKNALFKETLRSIKRSKARFISIIAIVALGISFFAGMKATAPDMKETAEKYYSESNFMDARVISPVGLTEDDIDALRDINGVDKVMPSRFVDGILKIDGQSLGDIDGSEMTCRVFSMDMKAAADFNETGKAASDFMNRITLIEGEWPTQPNECVVDGSALSAPDQFEIGQTFSVVGDGSNIENKLSVTEFKITGIIRTPLYPSFERGNTNIGSGKLGSFIFVSDEVFNFDYYTEAYLTVSGADRYKPYTEEYTNYIAPILDEIKKVSDIRLPGRVEEVRAEVEPKVMNGEAELAEKQAEFDQKIADGEAKLHELLDFAANGRAQIDAEKKKFNDSLSEAQRDLYNGSSEHSKLYREWREKQDQMNELQLKVADLDNARAEANAAKIRLDNAEMLIEENQKRYDQASKLVTETRSSLEFFKEHQNANKEQLEEWIKNSGLPPEEMEKLLETLNGFTAMGTAEEMIAYLGISLRNTRQSSLRVKKTLKPQRLSLQKTRRSTKRLKHSSINFQPLRLKLPPLR